MRKHRAADKKMNFFHTTREYRNDMKIILKNARKNDHNQPHMITLNELNQAGQKSMNQASHNLESGHKNDKF